MTLLTVVTLKLFSFLLQIKVFCDKGAERKARDEERRANKRKMNNTGAFHVSSFLDLLFPPVVKNLQTAALTE